MPWWDPQSTLFASIVRASLEEARQPEQALTIEEAMYAILWRGCVADFVRTQERLFGARQIRRLIVWHDNPYTVATADILKLTVGF